MRDGRDVPDADDAEPDGGERLDGRLAAAARPLHPDVHPPEPGRYRLDVRYAAMASRPLRVVLAGAVVPAGALVASSGAGRPAGQAWHAGGELVLG